MKNTARTFSVIQSAALSAERVTKILNVLKKLLDWFP